MDLITIDVAVRASLADALEAEDLEVVEHIPGIEADFAASGDGDPECIVIVHDPERLDALVLTTRLRALDLKAPIIILAPHAGETLRRLASAHNAEVMVDAIARPDALAAVVRNIVEAPGRAPRTGPARF